MSAAVSKIDREGVRANVARQGEKLRAARLKMITRRQQPETSLSAAMLANQANVSSSVTTTNGIFIDSSSSVLISCRVCVP